MQCLWRLLHFVVKNHPQESWMVSHCSAQPWWVLCYHCLDMSWLMRQMRQTTGDDAPLAMTSEKPWQILEKTLSQLVNIVNTCQYMSVPSTRMQKVELATQVVPESARPILSRHWFPSKTLVVSSENGGSQSRRRYPRAQSLAGLCSLHDGHPWQVIEWCSRVFFIPGWGFQRPVLTRVKVWSSPLIILDYIVTNNQHSWIVQ